MINRAIVLRQFHGRHKVALLDQKEGRIDAISAKQIPIGALIEYMSARRSGTLISIDRYTLIDLPFELAKDDLAFWHHVLELCYYFIPIGSCTVDIFDICSFLYSINASFASEPLRQKLYLFKLLTTIGLCPQLPEFSLATMHRFMALHLDEIADEIIDAQDEFFLNNWLHLCIMQHPAVAQFNTIQYLIAKQADHE